MKITQLMLLGLLFAVGPAFAADIEEKIEIKVVKAGDGQDRTIHWVGKGEDFVDLAVGESRTLEDGVVVSRGEHGLTVEVDGETVELPPHPPLHARAPHRAMFAGMRDGIAIISENEIDASTQETIRSVLASAGHDEKVHFVTGKTELSDVRIVSRVESD